MVSAPIETPSKAAAAQLDQLALSKPASIAGKLAAASEDAEDNKENLAIAQRKQHKSAQVVDELKNDGRDRFVGNPDITCDADEPILRENGRRFVLFPIQYHEVRIARPVVSAHATDRSARPGRVDATSTS